MSAKTATTAKSAVNEVLLDCVRTALHGKQRVEEKRMFGGIMFMVNDKMCISVGRNRLMCRIDPAIHDDAIKRKGCRTVTMGGRKYRGYVHVDESAVRTRKQFDYWLDLALRYNAQLKTDSIPKKS
jgi:TfoX/Sxy family transcriptional regulator of competence genes